MTSWRLSWRVGALEKPRAQDCHDDSWVAKVGGFVYMIMSIILVLILIVMVTYVTAVLRAAH